MTTTNDEKDFESYCESRPGRYFGLSFVFKDSDKEVFTAGIQLERARSRGLVELKGIYMDDITEQIREMRLRQDNNCSLLHDCVCAVCQGIV